MMHEPAVFYPPVSTDLLQSLPPVKVLTKRTPLSLLSRCSSYPPYLDHLTVFVHSELLWIRASANE